MIAGGFIFTSSMSCQSEAEYVGAGFCTAETIAGPTLWLWGESPDAVTVKKLLIQALIIGTLSLAIMHVASKILPVLPILMKKPIPNHAFMVHLSAPHGG